MHKLLAAIIYPERLQIFIELALVGLLIQDHRVRQHIIEPNILKILPAGVGLQCLKIGVAVDQAIHIDDGPLLDKLADVAATC